MASAEMTTVSRRRLVEAFGALGIVGAAGAATQMFSTPGAALASTSTLAATSHDHETTTTSSSAQDDDLTVDEMDAMHEAGVLAFPAATAGKGGELLEYEMDGDVKVFNLTCGVIDWEYLPGKTVEAWAYNGVISHWRLARLD